MRHRLNKKLVFYITIMVLLTMTIIGCSPKPVSTPSVKSPSDTESTTVSTPHEASSGTESAPVAVPDILRGTQIPGVCGYLIMKYDSNGQQVWKNIIGLGISVGRLQTILDSSGNTCIFDSKYNYKYDSNGKQIYYNNFPYNNVNYQAAVLDDDGNAYVAGSPNTADRISVFKYDSRGQQVWETSYQYPGSKYTTPSGIALDKSGNVYIVADATYSGDLHEQKLLLLKFDNQGNLLWAPALLAPQDNGLVQGNITVGPVVDNDGNIYVTGFIVKPVKDSRGCNYDYDYFTIKYDTTGAKLWEVYYDGPAKYFDIPHDLKVDAGGNVIVTGESDGLGDFRIREFATIKYDSEGKELWVSRYHGNNGRGGIPSALTIDNEGNIYVTGWAAIIGVSGSVYATVKYDPDGKQLWDASYDGIGEGLLNETSAIFVDNNGNVYVTGQCGIDSQYVTYDTIKYSPNGNILWVAKYSKAYFVYRPDALMVDALGNVYMIGPLSYCGKEDN